MKALHTTSALLEAPTGLALIAAPSLLSSLLLGVPLEAPAALAVARVAGAALLALAIACWLARADTASPAARGIVAAMLLYNIATAAALAYARLGAGIAGIALWPAVVAHAAMAVWCVTSLRTTPGKPALPR